jgi:hypothetical protein
MKHNLLGGAVQDAEAVGAMKQTLLDWVGPGRWSW